MKINKLNLLVFFSLLVATGCEDYLDKAPDRRLEVNSLEKTEAVIIGAYRNKRGVNFTHWSTDNATLAQNVYSSDPIIEDLYTWRRDFRRQTHQDSPGGYWEYTYNSIAHVNLALEALENIEITNTVKADALKAEALIMRSYCHFMLVNLFAKHYDSSSASKDLGIPYLMEVEKELLVNYERESVKSVYQKAETDLLNGIALLEKNSQEFNKNKYRFTLPSAYTYAARFFTFRNKDEDDVQQALQFANKAIEAFGGTEAMRPWTDYLSDGFAPIDVESQEVGMVQSYASWLMVDWKYHLTMEIRDDELRKNPFGKADNRFKVHYQMSGNVLIPAAYIIFRQGAPFNPANDLFPLHEAILLKAEAAIRLKDYNAAQEMLEYIGKNVYEDYNANFLSTDALKAYYQTSNSQKAWERYLLFERRNMFLFKGYRWFDIKRYELEVEHLLDNGSVIKLSEEVPDKDYQIPEYAIRAGMQANK